MGLLGSTGLGAAQYASWGVAFDKFLWEIHLEHVGTPTQHQVPHPAPAAEVDGPQPRDLHTLSFGSGGGDSR